MLVFSIVQCPEKHLAGFSVRTMMGVARTECQALWEAFTPRMLAELNGCFAGFKESFGISNQMDEKGDFTYWAAAELRPGAALPPGMRAVTLPAGPYAVCTVTALDQLGAAYEALWLWGWADYAPDMEGACFEVYEKNWTPASPFQLYCGLVKK